MAKIREVEREFIYQGVLNKNPSVLIDWFDDLGSNNTHYSWLSNFHEEPFMFMNFEFPTAEHAFQAMKFYDMDEEYFHYVRKAATPNIAKAHGRTGRNIRKDWEAIKYRVMKSVVSTKFLSSVVLSERLLDTGNAYLQEGTFWNDTIWGVDLTDKNGKIIEDPLDRVGQNWLGTILMETRGKLRLLYEITM